MDGASKPRSASWSPKMSEAAPEGAPEAPVKRKRGRPKSPRYQRRVDPIGPDEEAREPSDAIVWELLRPRYSKAARAVGDAAARTMSLADLLALEVATHAVYADEADKADPEGRDAVNLAGAKMQSRKTLRALTILLGPSRRSREERKEFVLPPELTEGTPEWIQAEARRELHPDDEILD